MTPMKILRFTHLNVASVEKELHPNKLTAFTRRQRNTLERICLRTHMLEVTTRRICPRPGLSHSLMKTNSLKIYIPRIARSFLVCTIHQSYHRHPLFYSHKICQLWWEGWIYRASIAVVFPRNLSSADTNH